ELPGSVAQLHTQRNRGRVRPRTPRELRMADWDKDAFEDQLIADMRAHAGAVTAGPLAGHPLLAMTSKGARSGQPRRAILTFSRDNGDYIVAGTAGGSPKAPNWIHNVRSNPDVQ